MAKYSIDLQSGNIKENHEKRQPEPETIIGIDLGTTNSMVAYVKDGQPLPVKDPENGYAIIPSIIHFDREGGIEVGHQAKDFLTSDPRRTIFSVKRLTGKAYKDIAHLTEYIAYDIIDDETESLVKVHIDDKFYTPLELSAEILKKLKQRVEHALGLTITKAVITVPAYFNDTQRQATRDAGKLAGLDVLRIINEPTAASLAYGLEYQANADETVAVYDLGGGTFDMSILRIEHGIFEVLSTHGDTFLGGDDFDRAIIQYWIKKYHLPKDLAPKLRLIAEEAKIHLSGQRRFTTTFEDNQLEISKAKFEKIITPIIRKTLEYSQQALDDAEITVSDIDHVLMVGGSTRVPLVRSTVSGFFNREVNTSLDPDQVVALGAAIQADILAGNNKEFLLLDITPLSLGIETMGGLMDVIIPRNSKIPTKVGRKYTTSLDGQKNLKISVFQGERDLVSDNRKLAEFILSDIPSMTAGIPKIEISFIINADGILQVKAKELRSGVQQSIEVRPQYGISEEEMAIMLKDSIINANEDMQKRGLLEARNEATNVIQSTEKFISQNKKQFAKEKITELNRLKALLQEKRNHGTKDQIHSAMKHLNKYAQPLAEEAMDYAIKSALKGKNIHEE